MLYGVVILLAIPSFILGVICSIEAWIIKVYVFRILYYLGLIMVISLSELPRITPLVIAWLSMQVIVDAFITSTLVYSDLHTIEVLIWDTSYFDHRVLPFANWFPQD